MKTITFGRNVLGRAGVAPDDPRSFTARTYSKPRVTVAPILTGTPSVGSVLSYVAGTWVGFSSIVYEWQRDGQFVQFSGPTYTVVAADAGHSITVLERATNASGGASSRSAPKVIP